MGDNYEKLFKSLNELEPSERVFNNIISRIEFRKRKTARMKLLLFSVATLSSFASLIPAFSYAASEFGQSGIYYYTSLIFSDFNLISVFWKDLLYLFAESLPLISLTAILIAFFIFLVSLKLILKNIKAAHLSII